MRNISDGDLTVEEADGVVSLTFKGRSSVVSLLALTSGSIVIVAVVTLSAINWKYGLIAETAFLGVFALVCCWLTWRFTSHQRESSIRFEASGIRIGSAHYSYQDIKSFGINDFGGAPFDPASMPWPRNFALGSHLYIETRGQNIPISMEMSHVQAKLAHEQFSRLFRIFAEATPTKPGTRI